MSENITPEVSQADLDSVMRKYDRESNTRIWTGKPKIAITLILAAFSIWCIYVHSDGLFDLPRQKGPDPAQLYSDL